MAENDEDSSQMSLEIERSIQQVLDAPDDEDDAYSCGPTQKVGFVPFFIIPIFEFIKRMNFLGHLLTCSIYVLHQSFRN